MKLKGKYLRNVTEFTDCEILIEYGKLQRVKFNSRQLMGVYVPKNRAEFELEKLSSEPIEFIPVGYNYVINYIGQYNDTQKIYLKLNTFKLVKLKWNIKKYLIQSREIKLGILKYLLIAVLSFIGGVLFQKNKVDNQNPRNPANIDNQKSFDQTNDQTPKNINDTLSLE